MDVSTLFDADIDESMQECGLGIAIVQIGSRLGDMQGNAERAAEALALLRESDCKPDLMILPPSFLSGAPVGALADSDGFLMATENALGKLASELDEDVVLVTTATFASESQEDDQEWVEERICLLAGGEIMILDNVCGACECEDDEFEEGEDLYELVGGFEIDDMRFIVVVGDTDALSLDELDADFIIVMDDSTYDEQRADLITGERAANDCAIAAEAGSWLLRVGCVGAQDSAVFPGGSYIVSPDGELVSDAVLFGEALTCLQIAPLEADAAAAACDAGCDTGAGEGADVGAGGAAEPDSSDDDPAWNILTIEYGYDDCDFALYLDESGLPDEAADWGAICQAARDYILKNGFTDVVVGLSGGLDSTMVACAAADALGSEHVHGVLMPSMYSSQGSIDDSLELANNLGIDTVTIPIDKPFDAFCDVLADPCGGSVEGIVRENLQARIRTIYIMALSNKYGWVMLNTGNKSESIAGYSTLYGDTSGAYSPFANIYKSRLYELAKWRNESEGYDIIPLSVILKAPSAELREDQTDQDSLPPYDVLDGISSLYLEYGCSANEIVEEGYDIDTVNRILRMVSNNEFKRRQEPLGPWVDGISLTDDRAWPVTNAYRDQVDEELFSPKSAE